MFFSRVFCSIRILTPFQDFFSQVFVLPKALSFYRPFSRLQTTVSFPNHAAHFPDHLILCRHSSLFPNHHLFPIPPFFFPDHLIFPSPLSVTLPSSLPDYIPFSLTSLTPQTPSTCLLNSPFPISLNTILGTIPLRARTNSTCCLSVFTVPAVMVSPSKDALNTTSSDTGRLLVVLARGTRAEWTESCDALFCGEKIVIWIFAHSGEEKEGESRALHRNYKAFDDGVNVGDGSVIGRLAEAAG